MAEYKDVEPLKKQMVDFKRAVNATKPMNSDYLTGYISALSAVEETISQQPTADVIEVVRCKDCVNFEYTLCGWCNEFERPITLDDFCSYGERKENDNG